MTQFNPEKKDVLTYGECLHPAMQIIDPEDAKQYLNAYSAYIDKALIKEPRTDGKTGVDIAKINLGYFAGYYDDETRGRVEKLFCCVHPVFGSIKANGSPSTEKALSMGMQAGADKTKN